MICLEVTAMRTGGWQKGKFCLVVELARASYHTYGILIEKYDDKNVYIFVLVQTFV